MSIKFLSEATQRSKGCLLTHGRPRTGPFMVCAGMGRYPMYYVPARPASRAHVINHNKS